MPTPNTTINQVITVVNASGIGVTNLSTVNLLVTFPDGSSTLYNYGSGVINAGGGAYSMLYNTHGVGRVIEEWSVVASDGVTIGQFRNEYQVAEGGS
jgi:hypothetical protein